MTPNKYRPDYLVFDRLNGQTYQTNLMPLDRWFNTYEEALAYGQAEVAKASETFCDDGTVTTGGYWHCKPLSVHVHSWFDHFKDAPPVFAPPPLSGPEWDKAWRQGPGKPDSDL